MWTEIKNCAVELFGSQRIAFTETSTSLVGEVFCESGLGQAAMAELLDSMRNAISQGCVFRIHNNKPRVVIIAATSRTAAATVEAQQGLKIAA